MTTPLTGWRPRPLRTGTEPDPRFTLANERTFLAWIRTSLGISAGALLIRTLDDDMFRPGVAAVLTVWLLALSILIGIAALIRWIRVESAMRHRRPLPLPGLAVVTVSAITTAATILLVAW